MRDSMIFYRYMYEALESLDDKEFRNAMKSIAEYAFYEKEPSNTNIIGYAILNMAKTKLDKGMESLEKQNGRRTQEYTNWRDEVFERDDYTCQMCGARGVELNAHHIMPYSKFPNLRTKLENGITLCKKCHKGVHNGK